VRLLVFVGALKDAGARSIVAAVPYLAYSRKDRRTKSRDPVTTRYMAAMLEAVGLDSIVTMDVHNLAAYENAFRCTKEHIQAAPLFVEHFAGVLEADELVVVLSPDAGGVKRARAFMEQLASATGHSPTLAFMEKQRSEGRVSGEAFSGAVADATVIIVDDLISGGTTMTRGARACRERGARRVYAAATHAVFGQGAQAALMTPDIESVVVTDSVGNAVERCPGLGARLVVLESAALFADMIQQLEVNS